jgi:hypothetical protein
MVLPHRRPVQARGKEPVYALYEKCNLIRRAVLSETYKLLNRNKNINLRSLSILQ